MGVRRRRVAVAVVTVVLLAGCSADRASQPSGPAPGPNEAEALEFTTPDGIELGGWLFGPADAPGVIVMAHQRGGSADDWADVAVAAAERGLAAFPFSFRGYAGHDGETDTSLDVDLAAAVAFVHERGFEQVGVAGASMGGTAALHLAGTEQIAAVAVLSPPREFAGLTVRPATVEEPVLLITADQDQPYRDDADVLQQELPAVTDLDVSGGAHGTGILAEHEAVIDHLVDFFEQQLAGAAS